MGRDYVFKQLSTHLLSIIVAVTDKNIKFSEIAEVLEDAGNAIIDMAEQLERGQLPQSEDTRN